MRLRSRTGSIVLGVVGAVYVIVALALLGWSLPTVGPWGTLRDYAVFVALFGAGAVGVWFVMVALASLHVHVKGHLPHFRRVHSGGPPGATLQ